MKTNMSFVLRGLCIIALAGVLFSCGEENDKVENGKITTTISLFTNAALQGRLTIDDAMLNLSRIEFEATSLGKNTIRSSKDFENSEQTFALTEKMKSNGFVTEAKIDRYNPFSFTLTSIPDSYNLEILETNGIKTFDFDAFKNNAKPALLVTGKFDNRGASTPIIIAIDAISPLEVFATQNGEPLIEVNVENLAEINLNPAVWFENISTQKFETAETITVQGRETIFIHSKFNTELYDDIMLQLETPEKSMTLTMTITKNQD